MSVAVMSWVFRESVSTGCARLVALALADRANDEGADCWPSIQTIAEKSRVSPRTAQRAIQELVDLGELEVGRNGGGSEFTRSDRRPNSYTFTAFAGRHADIPTEPDGVTSTTERGDTAVTQYVLDTSLDTSLIHAPAARRDHLADAVMAACGWDPSALTKSSRGRLNAALKGLRDAGATPAQVAMAAQVYRVRFRGAVLTPNALEANWPALNPAAAVADAVGAPTLPKMAGAIERARARA